MLLCAPWRNEERTRNPAQDVGGQVSRLAQLREVVEERSTSVRQARELGTLKPGHEGRLVERIREHTVARGTAGS